MVGLFCVAIAARGFEELDFRPACPPGASAGADSGVEWQCRPAVVDVLLRIGFAFGVVLRYV